MMRRPLSSTTASKSVLSVSTKSRLQLLRASTEKKGFHCNAGFVYGESTVRIMSYTWTDGVFGGESGLARRTSGSAFVCNSGRDGDSAVLYFDGASRGPRGPGGAGAYLLDGDGDCFWQGYKFFGRADNTVAEYQGLILGLIAAKDAGIDNVNVYGDSDDVIEQIVGERRIKSKKLKDLYSTVCDLEESFDEVFYNSIDSKDNKDADDLATFAMENEKTGEKWHYR